MTTKKSSGAVAPINPVGSRRNRAAAQPSIDAAIEKIEREMEKLRALAEIGLGQAEEVSREMAGYFAGSGSGKPGEDRRRDPIEAFERIAGAVRRAIMLEAKLAEELRALKLKRGDEQATLRADMKARPDERAEETGGVARARKERAMQEVKRIAEQAIKAVSRWAERERLLLNLDERLAEPDIEADCGERPISAIVARLCTDLGVVPKWQLWANEPWAVREARLNVPGSPFAGRRPGLQ